MPFFGGRADSSMICSFCCSGVRLLAVGGGQGHAGILLRDRCNCGGGGGGGGCGGHHTARSLVISERQKSVASWAV